MSKVPAVDKLGGSPSTGDRRSPVSCAPWLAHSGNGGAIAFDLDPNLIDASVLSSSRAVEQGLAALRQDRDALQRGFLEAARVQQRLGAPRHFRRGAFDIAGEMFPVEHVSGDFLTAASQTANSSAVINGWSPSTSVSYDRSASALRSTTAS